MDFMKKVEAVNLEKARLNKLSDRLDKALEIIKVYKDEFKVNESSLFEAIHEIATFNVYQRRLI